MVTYSGTTRSTASPMYNDFSVGAFRTECDSLLVEMSQGGKITSNQLSRMRALYNNFATHTHTAYDQYFLAYGNLNYTSSGANKTTTTPVGEAILSSDDLTNTKITAAILNEFVSKVNDINNHYHSITDTSESASGDPVNNPPVWVTPSTSYLYNVGESVFIQLEATDDGISQPLTYSIISGVLPQGLTLNSSSGVISGTPTTSEYQEFVVSVFDGISSAGRGLDITINALPVWVTPSSNYIFNIGDNVSIQLDVSDDGFTQPLEFTISFGQLPIGLSLSSSGLISGVPTTSEQQSFEITVADGNGSVSQSFGMIINALPVWNTPSTSYVYNIGDNVSIQLDVSDDGYTNPLVFSVLVGQLPQGLVLNTSTGLIYGNPTTSEYQEFTIRVDDGNAQVNQSFDMTINSLPQWVTNANLGQFINGSSVSVQLETSDDGVSTPVQYSVIDPLPSGLSLSSTGLLSGIVNDTVGTFTFTVFANDGIGQSSRTFTFELLPDNIEVLSSGDVVLLADFDNVHTAWTHDNMLHQQFKNGTVARTTTDKKFGEASLYFDGSQGSYLGFYKDGNNDWDFGTTDFCIECWVKPDDYVVSGTPSVMSTANEGNWFNTWGITLDAPSNGSSVVTFVGYDSTAANISLSSSGVNFHDGNWHHIAVTRAGNVVRLFANGIQQAQATFSGIISTPNTLRFGAAYTSASFSQWGVYKGYIDDVRIVKGQPIYTENFAIPVRSHTHYDNFEILRYKGTNSSETIYGSDWGTDDQMVYIFSNDVAQANHIYDSVRGDNFRIGTETIGETDFTATPTVDAFNNNGYSLQANLHEPREYTTWRWRAGQQALDNSGTLQSTVSYNPTSGFAIVTWTHDGSNSSTVGIGAPDPAMIWVFNRDGGGNADNPCWHKDIPEIVPNGQQQFIRLASTNNAESSSGVFPVRPSVGGNPTFTPGNLTGTAGQRMVAYVWWNTDVHDVFAYTGTGSDPGVSRDYVTRPQWTMFKSSGSGAVGRWDVRDHRRYDTSQDDWTDSHYLNSANADFTYDTSSKTIVWNDNTMTYRGADNDINHARQYIGMTIGAKLFDQGFDHAASFNGTSSYMYRTYTTPLSDGTRFTYSTWMRRASVNEYDYALVRNNYPVNESLLFRPANTFGYSSRNGSGASGGGIGDVLGDTVETFPAIGQWDHYLFVFDSNITTSYHDRYKIYVNGVQKSMNFNTSDAAESLYMVGYQSVMTGVNAYVKIGNDYTDYFHGDYAEMHYIDGAALTPDDFLTTDDGGTLVAKQYDNVYGYGNNGFYLKFDPTASNGVGTDWSGNNRHFVSVDVGTVEP